MSPRCNCDPRGSIGIQSAETPLNAEEIFLEVCLTLVVVLQEWCVIPPSCVTNFRYRISFELHWLRSFLRVRLCARRLCVACCCICPVSVTCPTRNSFMVKVMLGVCRRFAADGALCSAINSTSLLYWHICYPFLTGLSAATGINLRSVFTCCGRFLRMLVPFAFKRLWTVCFCRRCCQTMVF